MAAETDGRSRVEVLVPRVDRAPQLEDFLDGDPGSATEAALAKVEGFVQRQPRDGSPSSERTVVYLGYDDDNLYAVFLCFDRRRGRIRARMGPREQIFSDDTVSLQLDTFRDQRRAYAFSVNPLGVQQDAVWTEGQGFDPTFDTVWYSKGRLTSFGYAVWMAIPFRSLRFPAQGRQTWGVLLSRTIPHLGEEAFWPAYSLRVEGRLNQMADLVGLENVAPARNTQLIVYNTLRSFRTLDATNPVRPRFHSRAMEPAFGVDAKFVFRESLVLDLTVNPDFSQVESDEPQVTVNRRFEVFFPEKRPFFLENASFFRTPIELVFTRRIADPVAGARLTGKVGPYLLGALVAYDGRQDASRRPAGRLRDDGARFTIVRIGRDILRQSSVGFIFTEWSAGRTFNRVGGADARFKLSRNWVLALQAATSSTRLAEGDKLNGVAYHLQLSRSGRSLKYEFEVNGRDPGFLAGSGFVNRTDVRGLSQQFDYCFRPERHGIVCWGPGARTELVFDHAGTRLDAIQTAWFGIDFIRGTSVSFVYRDHRERVRPEDVGALESAVDLYSRRYELDFRSGYFEWLTFSGTVSWGTRPNFVPAPGRPPSLGDHGAVRLAIDLRPTSGLSIRNSLLVTRLRDSSTGSSVFDNRIFRSRWHYQFNRELSLRVIVQYDDVVPDPGLTALEIVRNINGDVLLTYLVHPGTAVYLGYNGNLQNLDPRLLPADGGLARTRDRLIHDGWQVFAKFSYLFRP